jgi:hypothetical protein
MTELENFAPNLETARLVRIVNLEPVQELRHWSIRWLPYCRYRKHPQLLCFRAADSDTCYVTPHFLERIAGVDRIQRDAFWDGIPELESVEEDDDDVAARRKRLAEQRARNNKNNKGGNRLPG